MISKKKRMRVILTKSIICQGFYNKFSSIENAFVWKIGGLDLCGFVEIIATALCSQYICRIMLESYECMSLCLCTRTILEQFSCDCRVCGFWVCVLVWFSYSCKIMRESYLNCVSVCYCVCVLVRFQHESDVIFEYVNENHGRIRLESCECAFVCVHSRDSCTVVQHWKHQSFPKYQQQQQYYKGQKGGYAPPSRPSRGIPGIFGSFRKFTELQQGLGFQRLIFCLFYSH